MGKREKVGADSAYTPSNTGSEPPYIVPEGLGGWELMRKPGTVIEDSPSGAHSASALVAAVQVYRN